jgi:hypothetical protein
MEDSGKRPDSRVANGIEAELQGAQASAGSQVREVLATSRSERVEAHRQVFKNRSRVRRGLREHSRLCVLKEAALEAQRAQPSGLKKGRHSVKRGSTGEEEARLEACHGAQTGHGLRTRPPAALSVL